jgi:hypothetical protein
MKKRCLLEFTVDVATAAADLTEIIAAVLALNPGRELEILRALDEEIGVALDAAEGGEEVGIN